MRVTYDSTTRGVAVVPFLSVLGISFPVQGVFEAFATMRKDGYVAGAGSLSGFASAVGTLYGLWYLLSFYLFA